MELTGLKFGPPGSGTMHLCIDMQCIFAEATPWYTPWMKKILPQVCTLAEWQPDNLVFTRFITPETPAAASGAWRRYYNRWHMMTQDKLEPGILEILPELKVFSPPAMILDKYLYSPWVNTDLHQIFMQRKIDTLIMSGGETDVCLMAAVAGAVDLGYRVIIAGDAICSSSDETHDEMANIYCSRYDMQIEVAATEEILRHWPGRRG